jgi:hypothetical protein
MEFLELLTLKLNIFRIKAYIKILPPKIIIKNRFIRKVDYENRLYK